MRTGKISKMLNVLWAVILLCVWGSVFIVHGLSSSVAWAVAKMYLAPAGVILGLIYLIGLVICLIRKKKKLQVTIGLLLCICLAFPILMLVNVLPVAFPADINKTSPAITVRWPLQEKTLVGWGGDSVKDNKPHAVWASERWAYDLVMEPSNVHSKRLEDYGIYGKEVVAPVTGTVIAAYDEEKDITPDTEDFLSMEGNHVYIKIDETGTYLLLNHLKKGSVTVKIGDHVKAGDLIGRVGNSGSTSEPHLHIHH